MFSYDGLYYAFATRSETKGEERPMTATTAMCLSSLIDPNSKISIMVQKNTIRAQRPKVYNALQTVQAPCKVENPQCTAEIAGISPGNSLEAFQVIRSGNPSARRRRLSMSRQKYGDRKMYPVPNRLRQSACVEAHGLQHCMSEYVNDGHNQGLLSHEQVIYFAKKIRVGVLLEDCKKRLQEKLGYEPSYIQWAAYTNLSPKELNASLFESARAIDKLVRVNTPLVISVANKYKNMGIDIKELTQEGVIGLVRGLRKFDYTKGVKLSTFVYWWIRLAISRFVVKHSRIIQLPDYLHHFLGSINNVKMLLKEDNATTTIERIAMTLNVSDAKVKNAIKAQKRIISMEGQRHINDEPCVISRNYIIDYSLENQPWFIEGNRILKEDINNLINSTLTDREKKIIRQYFGLDAGGCLWKDIGKRLGLSRETVRQLGIRAIQKLKYSAIYHKLDPLSIHYLK
ncbi:RNA polymerase sigma factor sigA isoform X2 [Cryptomeria japonica]|uniref:RNA polymerase sigma factor sigA isoform X2 n=2 Tax=Cryptomeria japonica TaxID=3369 RepID=UPI0027DA49BE|nr:RNA polymerase sigma factor sigA isoform X2 [Cryptomeria japonica]